MMGQVTKNRCKMQDSEIEGKCRTWLVDVQEWAEARWNTKGGCHSHVLVHSGKQNQRTQSQCLVYWGNTGGESR